MSNEFSVVIKAIGLCWLCIVASVGCYGAENDRVPSPGWLQGRASDAIDTRKLYTKSQIAERFTRPDSISGLLKNLKIVWDDKLLVQPAFFTDHNLITCLGGTHAAWRNFPADPSGKFKAWKAHVSIQDDILDATVADVSLNRQYSNSFKSRFGYIPSHEHYFGAINLAIKGKRKLTWGDVVRVFGPTATTIQPDIPVDGGPPSDPRLYIIRYSYPGDDPSRWGEVEMPQMRVFLRSEPMTEPRPWKITPKETDVVWSILIIESANRRPGAR